MWHHGWGSFQNGVGNLGMLYGRFGGLLSVILLILVLYMIFRLLRPGRVKTTRYTFNDNYLNILKTRLANGEISTREYQQTEKTLKQ